MDMFAALTPREQEVIRLMAEGRPNKEIAAVLDDITVRSVERHVSSIFIKLGVNNRTEAAILYCQYKQGP